MPVSAVGRVSRAAAIKIAAKARAINFAFIGGITVAAAPGEKAADVF
jgi:hypothetical protein